MNSKDLNEIFGDSFFQLKPAFVQQGYTSSPGMFTREMVKRMLGKCHSQLTGQKYPSAAKSP